MAPRLFLLFLVLALLLPAAKKTMGTARGENEDLILYVTVHIDAAGVKELIGDDLGAHYIVAEVKVEPKYGKDITIDRDDFQLRTDKDGERTKPLAPSQIAGRGLVLKRTGGPGGLGEERPSGWSLGGIGMGGGGGVGTGTGDPGSVKATMENGDKENPLKKVLDAKVLPEKKTDQPTSGLLYFPMELQRLKDLELTYGGRENRISMRFKYGKVGGKTASATTPTCGSGAGVPPCPRACREIGCLPSAGGCAVPGRLRISA